MTVKHISSCFFHDDKISVTHCNVCMKPLCEDCVKAVDGGKYCSDDCASKAKRSVAHIQEINEINAITEAAEKKHRTQMMIVNIIMIIVLVGGLIICWRENVIPAASKKQFEELVKQYAPFLDFIIKFLNGK